MLASTFQKLKNRFRIRNCSFRSLTIYSLIYVSSMLLIRQNSQSDHVKEDKSMSCTVEDRKIETGVQFDPENFDLSKAIVQFRCYLNDKNDSLPHNLPEKGIVTSAGSENSLANAFSNFYVLKHIFKVEIPLVIAYWGAHSDDRPSEKTQQFMTGHIPGLQFMDLSAIPYPVHHLGINTKLNYNGWTIKAYSVYAAPFKNVLFLDSDNLVLKNPMFLFESNDFKATGNMFWPDLFCGITKLQQDLGMPNDHTRQTESGQILLNKEKHADVLEWILWLNSRNRFTYKLDYGDKDTYKSAFFLAGKLQLFHQVEYGLALALSRQKDDSKVVANSLNLEAFVQFCERGEMLFFHRISAHKFEMGGDVKVIPTMITPPSCNYFQEKGWNPNSVSMEHIGCIFNEETCPKFSPIDIHGSSVACSGYDSRTAEGSMKLPVFQIPANSSIFEAMKSANKAFLLLKNLK